MKQGIALKFLVLVFTALSLVVSIGCGAGIVALESAGLYVNDLDSLQSQEFDSIAKSVAESYAQQYAATNLGNLPYVLRKSMYPDPFERSDARHWKLSLYQEEALLKDAGSTEGYTVVKQYRFAPLYPMVSLYGPNDGPASEPEASDPASPTSPPKKPSNPNSMYQEVVVPEDYLFYEQDTQWNGAGFTTYYLYYYQAPEYEVTVYMHPDVLDNSSLYLLTTIFPYRHEFIAVLILAVLLFFVGFVYLCYTAGRRPDGTYRLAGLNALPLDVYLLGGGGLVWLASLVLNTALNWVENEGPHPGKLSLVGINLWVIVIMCLGFVCAVAAQLRQPSLYWWRHSLSGRLCKQLGRFFRFVKKGISAFFALIPVVWKWMLTALIMAVSLIASFLWAWNKPWAITVFFVVVAVCSVVTIYSGYAFGSLISGVRRMNQGDLRHKISTRFMFGNFYNLAQELNSLSETAMVAAENETRSERMKSELITNVSHDIKTPLTSIINFVDLLQKPHSPEQGEEYLEVLSRQSARMKKLIDDLMELSKASSGNTTVDIQVIDPVETVNQALGEFSDKLSAAGLETVFRHSPESLLMQADGKLTWRVLSNLLSNAVKYAMPQTRLYVDLTCQKDTVVLSVKNISRQELNLSAGELLDRFVRSDLSRNSEGSGLGLNIAKNLMELQHGAMELTLDGDLFKVTLYFPRAKD